MNGVFRRVVVAGIGAAALAGCSRSAPPPPGRIPGFEAPPPAGEASLLLVTLDTFRADAAGCGGNPAGRTPQLDRIARRGMQFVTGIASTPITAPSHASILTGLDPPAHGVRDNGTFHLAKDTPRIPAALAEHGFATAAFVTAFPLDARFGFDLGFSTYDDVDTGGSGGFMLAQRPGLEAVAAARSWWAERQAPRWFVWIHLFDAHVPNDAPRPLVNACGRDPYLADVSVADAALGAALDAAAETGRPFWTVVLGDHGESRGQHGEATHGLFIYDATIRIPAVIWPSPRTPGLVDDVFRQIDFPATAFELLGLPPADAPGTGVPAPDEDAPAAYSESQYARFHYGWAGLASLRDGRWKYIDAPDPELYDLEADPGEQHNEATAQATIASALAGDLAPLGRDAEEASPDALDPEARAALAALGYLSSRGSVRGDAPDPKRMLAVEGFMARAQSLMSAGQWDAAAATLSQAVARDPRNKEVYQMYGQIHAGAGRDGMAVDSYRKALSLPPHRTDRVIRFELASAYLRLGKPSEAVAPLESILEEDPADAPTWHNLGVAREGLGQQDRAREAWQRALRIDPGFDLPRRALERTAQPSPGGAPGVGG